MARPRVLCESPEGRAILGRSVRRSVSSGASNSLPSSFFTITDFACVASAAKAPDCRSGSPESDTAGSSPAACTRRGVSHNWQCGGLQTRAHAGSMRVRLVPPPPASRTEGWARATPSGPENRRSLKTPVGSTPTPSSKISRTRSSAELERDPAEVEAARSNRAGFTTLHAGVAQFGKRRLT